MVIIEKENVDNYRYTVGKIVFLRVYDEFELLENFPNSNLILVKTNKNEKIYISLFGVPTSDNEFELPLFNYYERKPGKLTEKNKNFRILNKKFASLYKENLEIAFKKPDIFVKTLNSMEKELFQSIIKINDESDLKLYKYRSKESVQKNKYNVRDGQIAFSSPKSFNDPFDCNIQFINNKDMSGLFRVLCLAKDQTNILMWSYYGDSHKGYCFEYKANDIREAILQSEIDGLCIVGDVNYKSKRPDQRAPVRKFSYTDIKFYIDASFTKFDEWKHEREYRYVIISDNYQKSMLPNSHTTSNNEHISFVVPINTVYEGINGDKSDVYDSKGNVIPREKLQKHSTIFKVYS